jgi:hypothetical protein
MLNRFSITAAARHLIGTLALTSVLCFVCVVMLPT